VGVHLSFIGGTRPRAARNTAWSFVAGTEEGTTYTSGLFRVSGPGQVSPTLRARIVRSLRSGIASGAALKSTGTLTGGWDQVITFPARRLKSGFYVYAARIVAQLNPSRKATYVGRPFSVGSTGRTGALRKK
jgi:hypothetical protein